jgi:CheY-like chemotaxis protein
MSSATILIVDDAADTLHMISTLLKRAGFRVLLASDGDTGLNLAFEHRPDVVITDMLMPGTSGFRVIDRLKCDPTFQPKIVMISAQEAPLLRAYASALGADDFLIKPFVLQQLLDSVRRLCPQSMPICELNGAVGALIEN